MEWPKKITRNMTNEYGVGLKEGWNDCHDQCSDAIESITEEELLRVINNVSLLSVPISQERKLIAKSIRALLLKKVGRV